MMLQSSLRSVLAGLCFVAAVSARAGLSLTVSGPEAAVGVEQLKVVTTLVNTGDVTLKLLNDPRGALSTAPTHTFTIEDAAGNTPAFTGRLVKYVPATVIAMGNAEFFTVLAPGQSVELTHDLSEAYNFTRTGEGVYSIEASNLFHYVDPLTNQATAIRADSPTAHTAKLTGRLAVARQSHLQKRIAYNGCSASRQSLLATAANNAITYARNSLSYLQSHTSSTTRYVTWFGTFTTARKNTVQTHFQNMVNNPFTSNTYDCTCTDSAYAYVYPNQWAYIYLCNAFWSAPATGTDSKAGTLVHESSHFTNIGSTQDYAYGQSACRSLAQSSPARAVANADSHEYFAENTPSQP